MIRRWACVAAFVAAQATAASADGGWQPPDGWTIQNPTGTPMILIWTGPRAADFTPNINVLWDRRHDVDAAWVSSADSMRASGIAVTSESVTCALGPGVRFEYSLPVGARSYAIVTYLAPDRSGGTYVATYTRLAGGGAEGPVIAALTGICASRPEGDPPRRDMAQR